MISVEERKIDYHGIRVQSDRPRRIPGRVLIFEHCVNPSSCPSIRPRQTPSPLIRTGFYIPASLGCKVMIDCSPNFPLLQLDTWVFPVAKRNFSHIARVFTLSRHSILLVYRLTEWNHCCWQDPHFQSIFIHTASHLLGEGIVIQPKLEFWKVFILLVYHYNANWTRRPQGFSVALSKSGWQLLAFPKTPI